jgi:hypothetical protein
VSRSEEGHAEDAARMRSVRDHLLEATATHEAECPGGGRPCRRTRCGQIAYLCHALGLRGEEAWALVRREAEGYDARCPARHESGVCDG